MPIPEFAQALIGDKRRWRAYKERTRQLPDSHRTAVEGIERYLLRMGPADGESATAMLEGLIDVFERGAAQGMSIDDIVGEDPVAFAESFFEDHAHDGWIAKERQQLTKTLMRAGRAGEERR